MEKRTYQIENSRLQIIFGDITTSTADVIVSSDDSDLSMGGGVSRAILESAGESLLIDATKHQHTPVGEVAITTAGALPAIHIFHIATILNRDAPSDPFKAENAIRKCLSLLGILRLSSIAFPALGTGAGGNDIGEIATQMAEFITKFIKETQAELEISIYLHDRFGTRGPLDYIAFYEEFAKRSGAKNPRKPAESPFTSTLVYSERSSITRQLSELSRGREKIEMRLLNQSLAPESRAKLENELEEIHTSRIELLRHLSMPKNKKGAKLFISYAHDDLNYFEQFKTQLSPLIALNLIQEWHDRKILPGQEWDGLIDENLNSADVIVFLISASFIESQYCRDIEMATALKRHKSGEALAIPIIIRPIAAWKEFPFAKLQVLPNTGKAVSTHNNIDLAWADVIDGIKESILEYMPKK